MPTTNDEKYIDVESAVRLKEAEGKIEIQRYELETAAKFRELEITEVLRKLRPSTLPSGLDCILLSSFLFLSFLFSSFLARV